MVSMVLTRPALASVLPALLLAGCAGFSHDGGLDAVSAMTQERIGQPVHLARSDASSAPTPDQLKALLREPLDATTAVDIALRNNAGLSAALAGLGVSEADFVQAGRLRNPGLSFTRVRGGGDGEIDRGLVFDLAGLLTLPARRGIEARRFEQAKLQAAAMAVGLAADTRRAYFTAIAAAQKVTFMEQVETAAQASAELAAEMARAGNWSKLDQQRQQVFYAEATAQVSRARLNATAAREQLIRLLGLPGEAAGLALTLPQRLPDLPAKPPDITDAESLAMDRRLDVLMARRDTAATAAALGLTRASAFVNVLDAGYANQSQSGLPRENGYSVSLELPVFDWGEARTAKAEALYKQAMARTADTAIRARSEVRLAYAGYRSAWELARHYRDDVVPLRKQISDEVLLRYNGMLLSIFDLLSDAREQVASVDAAIETQRDFWIADTDLQAAINSGNGGNSGNSGNNDAASSDNVKETP
jgi:outer membrane protein TolC